MCFDRDAKERNLVHPKMVLVHDQSQESSVIGLFEVGGGWSTLTPWPFFSGWIAFQNFLVADLEFGGKKVEGEKKVRKQVERNRSRLPAPTTRSLPVDFDRTDDQCFSEQMCEQ
jgi:hypothetical protein